MIAFVLVLACGGLSHVLSIADAPCPTDDPKAWAICQRVAAEARRHGVPVPVACALAYEESRFTDGPVSRVGAVGPMQVVPRYACPRGRLDGCDTVAVGVAYLGTLARRHGLPEALCRYNAGNVCTAPARRFARAVLARARTMSAR